MLKNIVRMLILFTVVACKNEDSNGAVANNVKQTNDGTVSESGLIIYVFDLPSLVRAPGEFAGKAFNHTIQSGEGVFASTGSFVLRLSVDTDAYVIQGDGIMVNDSAGTFTYHEGTVGYLDRADSIFANISCVYYFYTETSGSYRCFSDADVNSDQWGDFVEIIGDDK